MRLDLCTWMEVETYLTRSKGIFIPCGSHEQHGPIGLIGTDAICAETIAEGVAEKADALVTPTLALTPAPFNMAFPGTISISPDTFKALVREIVEGLASQGFEKFYFLNGHGANLAPLKQVADALPHCDMRIRSWWDFDKVNELREAFYGDWEGMHATPSEVAITQATHRVVTSDLANDPPQKLSAQYMRDHAGDKHGPADEHRASFPDGRVGSHSVLARPEQGEKLLQVAIDAVSDDYAAWIEAR